MAMLYTSRFAEHDAASSDGGLSDGSGVFAPVIKPTQSMTSQPTSQLRPAFRHEPYMSAVVTRKKQPAPMPQYVPEFQQPNSPVSKAKAFDEASLLPPAPRYPAMQQQSLTSAPHDDVEPLPTPSPSYSRRDAGRHTHQTLHQESAQQPSATGYNPQCPCPDCVAYYHHCDAFDVPEFEYDSYYGAAPVEDEADAYGSSWQQYPPPPAYEQAQEHHVVPADDKPLEPPQPIVPADASNKKAAVTVMCCYHKQGRCKMGEDCWYSHDGDATTPCHYGALCKAGHRHLVKSGNGAASMPLSKPRTTKSAPKGGNRSRPTGSATRRPAQSKPSSMPCAFCGGSDCVRTQEYPVFVGSEMVMGLRAHCSRCLRTYAL